MLSNRRCVHAAVSKLSARAGATLRYTHNYHDIYGQPATTATVLRDAIRDCWLARAGAALGSTPPQSTQLVARLETDLHVGQYAIAVTEDPKVMSWALYVLISVSVGAEADDRNVLAVDICQEEPTAGARVLRITVRPSAWAALLATTPAAADAAVTRAMAAKHVWTMGRELAVCCICSVKPHKQCMNCGITEVADLSGEDMDHPRGPGEKKPWLAKDVVAAYSEHLENTMAAWHQCLSDVVDSDVDAGADFCPTAWTALKERWGTHNTVLYCGPPKDVEERMGRLTDAWLREALTKHPCCQVKPTTHKRPWLVGQLRNARQAA